ncbi:MAG: dipicolinate synthase subunit B [Clostridia bacterium]|nr:dipicolinate synthase subunit B [Clostridia bacterium]MDD4798910.1 dipicolinate synthase subunit B [Clostridia bacterium]
MNNDSLKDLKIGFALTGSFCTLHKAIKAIYNLKALGADIRPIVSDNVCRLDTKFGTTEYWRQELITASGCKDIIDTIPKAEPIGPDRLFDIMVIAPCSGNSLGKLADSITDTPVLMAAKAHLRNNLPLVVAISTNDGLAASCKNIGQLLNTKNIYFVPFLQDNPENKPNSLVADFSLLPQTLLRALKGQQIQPVLAITSK